MANLSKTQTVAVNLAVVNNSVVVASKTLSTQQVGATTFLTGPTGPQGPKGDTGATGASITDASLLTTGTLSAARLPALTGDITTSAGSSVTAISTGVIINSDVNATANIDATKLGTGIVNNTELNYLDGVTSAIQTQINGKAATTHTHVESDVTGLVSDLASKQATLVSGTNIKTINGTTLLGSGDLTIAGGGSATSAPYIVVASSTATTKQKAFADYVCTGTNDHTTINSALSALPGGKGTVMLTAGTFNTAGTINISSNQVLIGQAPESTQITGNATTFDVIHMGNRQADGIMRNFMGLKDLSVSSAGGANSFSTIWADGMGNGSYIENVKASEGKYNFRLTDLDQCSVTNIKGFNPRTASIYVEVGLENTWGNVAFYSPSMALSDNNSTCLLIAATAAQTSPNKVDRLTVYGALFYASTGLTGTTGLKATVGATSFGIYGSLFENPQVHVSLTDTTFMSFNNCTFLQNSGVSTDIIQYNTNNHTTTFTDCRFQQATNAFHSNSGFPRIVFLGSNTNQGTITNLFVGTFGAKHGTDTDFTGSGVIAMGINSFPLDYGFINHFVGQDIQLTSGAGTGKVLTSDVSGNATWQTPTGGGSGIVRSVNNVSTNTTVVAVANTDYVYNVTATATITLPTAVGNTNRYTIKNVGTGTVTVNTTSSQTMDGSTTASWSLQYASYDFVSNGSNWTVE